jgi:transposase
MSKQRRTTLPRILDILRLRNESSLSERAIAQSLSVSRGTVGNILARVQAASITWPLPPELDETRLESMLFPKESGRPKSRTEPDWNTMYQESKRKNVTLQLLWIEYKSQHKDGFQYSQFCERFNQWKQKLQLSLRQEHKAGEKLFIDYAGDTVTVIDAETGEMKQAQLFVATLGASSYTYVEAQWGQDLQSFVNGHVRAFKYFGGTPELLIPDNLKSGVKKADRYEPILNRTYYEMASHYGCAIIPTRPYKPKDKAKVEAAVQLVQRWIVAVLRNQKFFSLAELNFAIGELLIRLNEKPFQKMAGSRKTLFESLDKPALRSLPTLPYAFAIWRTARVNIDYHITLEYVHYSVPFTLVRQEVDVRMTEFVIEIYHKHNRVASHRRAHHPGQMVTESAHRPKSHQKHLEWTPTRLIQRGSSLGPNTGKLIERILERLPHPEQGYRSCLGILSLSKRYEKEVLESAAARALAIGGISYRSVKSILEKGLGQLELPLDIPETPLPMHENVRGASYYQDKNLVH